MAILKPMIDIHTSVPKNFQNGTHRLYSPENTLEKVLPLLPAMGITRIADVTGLDNIRLPVVMVCRPNSRSLATSQGKGLTLDAAKASGVMESIELHHAEHIILPLILGSYEELRHTQRLVDVYKLPSAKNGRFHPNLQLLWIASHDLVSGEEVLLPYEVVHASAKSPAPTGSGCFSSTSNGLASGNHLLEALLHGICEVVERDATALWEAGGPAQQRKTRLDLDTVDDPHCLEVLSRLAAAKTEVAVWETTTDVRIPAFFCQINDHDKDSLHTTHSFTGMGCHTAREIALLRALTEAVQCRLTLVSGSRDDLFRREYKNNFHEERLISGGYHALIDMKDVMRPFDEVPTHCGNTFNDDISWALKMLRKAGLTQVLAVDLTKPELNIPVVRVVIPGLEGPDDEAEYVPGARALAIMDCRQ
jgi:YcaO-like protein with predicted kinase domain